MRTLTVVAALTLACAQPQKLPTMASPHEELTNAVERFFDEDLRLHPFRATYIGDHRFDGDFGDPSSEATWAADRRNAERTLAAVTAIDEGKLDARDLLTREVFIYNARLFLEGLRFEQRLLPLNQMDSPLLDFARMGAGDGPQPFDTAEQHALWLSRADGFSAWADSAIAAMQLGEQRGITEPKVAMKHVLGQLDDFLSKPFPESIFAAPMAKAPTAELKARYARTFEGSVYPALKKLRDFIAHEYLPRCRESAGWSSLPDGDGWYRWQVRAMTTTELSPEEIHALGLSEVARIRSGMEQVKAEVGFKGTFAQFLVWARENPAFYFDKPDDLLREYLALKKQIDAALPSQFSLFPRADYEIRPIEAYRAESAAGGEYQPPPDDGSRPGIFYVNTFNLHAQPKYGMRTLSLHEAAPGHHFQIALQQELSGMPRFRRFGGYTAYTEGWALYAETLGFELGLYQEPMDRYGHLADAQLRAMRLVVDTGLHAKGWTREQAIAYMLENSSMAPTDVTAEVERYMVWPGQALGYKVGQLRISALKARAKEALGDRFDVKAWHAAILSDGALPLDVLQKKLERWVDDAKR